LKADRLKVLPADKTAAERQSENRQRTEGQPFLGALSTLGSRARVTGDDVFPIMRPRPYA